jgi:hypothetical protein
MMVGQVKSGAIYDKEKYGGDVEALYRNNREEFFKNFGIDQLIESFKRLAAYGNTVDPKFPLGHTCEIFPCIIVNDRAFQTPFMADTFNKRFNEIKNQFAVRKVTIHPITIMHISDWEWMEEYLATQPGKIWDLLYTNFKGKRFIPPFYATINGESIGLVFPKKIQNAFSDLVKKYGPPEVQEESGELD